MYVILCRITTVHCTIRARNLQSGCAPLDNTTLYKIMPKIPNYYMYVHKSETLLHCLTVHLMATFINWEFKFDCISLGESKKPQSLNVSVSIAAVPSTPIEYLFLSSGDTLNETEPRSSDFREEGPHPSPGSSAVGCTLILPLVFSGFYISKQQTYILLYNTKVFGLQENDATICNSIHAQ